MDATFHLSGTSAISVQFGDEISMEVNSRVRMLFYELEKEPVAGITETVPTYAALMIHYRPEVIRYKELIEILRERIMHMGNYELPDSEVIEIPVLYGGETGVDLEECARIEGISTAEFIKIHSGSEYYIYMLGFAPGHPYSARFENPFHFKRREKPRIKVPGRSVVAAEALSDILPFEQPCGWNIIGSTPVEICDYRQTHPFLLEAGQWIKYVPVDENEYRRIREAVKRGTYQCRRYKKVVETNGDSN